MQAPDCTDKRLSNAAVSLAALGVHPGQGFLAGLDAQLAARLPRGMAWRSVAGCLEALEFFGHPPSGACQERLAAWAASGGPVGGGEAAPNEEDALDLLRSWAKTALACRGSAVAGALPAVLQARFSGWLMWGSQLLAFRSQLNYERCSVVVNKRPALHGSAGHTAEMGTCKLSRWRPLVADTDSDIQHESVRSPVNATHSLTAISCCWPASQLKFWLQGAEGVVGARGGDAGAARGVVQRAASDALELALSAACVAGVFAVAGEHFNALNAAAALWHLSQRWAHLLIRSGGLNSNKLQSP